MNAKHTPGPWRVSLHLKIVTVEWQKNQREPKEQICDCRFSTCQKLEQEANAHLIAAAPEMLDALIEAEEYISEIMGPADRDDRPDQANILTKIRNAIRKARGKQ